ncbi:MAG: DUF4190 domain-containing protein [Actinobacteria bacterium]|nr:DUF4190 domain-containing protein [Actinomycetota bacterium]
MSEDRQELESRARSEASGREMNERAMVSLALSIFWVFGFGSVAAIYLGVRALREIGASEGRESGRAMAWTAIAASAVGLVGTMMVVAVWVAS